MKYIQSVQNDRVKQWKKLHTKKGREKTGLYMVEGEHLVEEAVKEKERVTEIIISQTVQSPIVQHIKDIPIYLVSEEVAKSLSDTETSQKIFAICKQIEVPIQDDNQLLLVDSIQDPGNLGTIIRTADAAGIGGIILGDGTVDLYNSKVLRSAQGSHFHIPIVKGNLEKWIQRLKEKGIPVYGTALQNGKRLNEVKKTNPFAIIVGNEGNGIQGKLLELTTENVYIPIYGKSESLNVAVAAGIVLYYFKGVS